MAKSSKKKIVKKSTTKAAVETPVEARSTEKKNIDTIPHSTKDNITPHDKFNSAIFIVALVAAIVLLIVVSPIGNQPETTEYQEPAKLDIPNIRAYFENPEVTVGDELIMYVETNNFEDLVAFEFSIAFNSNVIRYKSSEYLDFLADSTAGAEEKICVTPKDKGSEVTSFACVKFPDSPGHITGVSGSGSIAKVAFDVIGRGDIMLQMNDVKILNSEKEFMNNQVVLPGLIVK